MLVAPQLQTCVWSITAAVTRMPTVTKPDCWLTAPATAVTRATAFPVNPSTGGCGIFFSGFLYNNMIFPWFVMSDRCDSSRVELSLSLSQVCGGGERRLQWLCHLQVHWSGESVWLKSSASNCWCHSSSVCDWLDNERLCRCFVRTSVCVSACRGTWVMACSAWRAWCRLWTAAWRTTGAATPRPPARICITMVTHLESTKYLVLPW